MVVLHIIRGLGLAGAENHLIMLLAGLRARGVDARLLLITAPGRPADDVFAAAQAHGIPVIRQPMRGLFDPPFFIWLWRTLRAAKPDIVHTHLVHAETYAIPAARLAGVRHVVNSSHNDDPFRRRWFFRPRNWVLWRLTDRGIAISEHIRRFVIGIEGARPAQVKTIHYGYAPPEAVQDGGSIRRELGIPIEAPVIGSVCRLTEQKGLRYALDALPRVLAQFPQAHYIMAGDGPLRDDLRAQVAHLGLAERVHFLGWRADKLAVMAACDIFLAPSLWEGFGLVFLEAMAQALPIVSTQVSAVPEIVQEGVTGHLVPPRDVGALAAALIALLSDPQRACELGAAGQARLASIFRPERMIDQTLAIYADLQGELHEAP
ncbi:MAG: glycosyltransferase [Anaerolineales bacterium]